jgi:hypothetical protein
MSVRDEKFTNGGVEADTDVARHAVYKDKPFYYEHAQLSAAAYNPARWEQRTTKMGYDIDKSLSSHVTTVYVRRRDKKAIVAYKGTSPKEWKKIKDNDLVADAGILFGVPNYFNARFRQADNTYKAVASKYGARKVEVTGHSLGGSQAVYVGRLHNAKGTAFEPGAGPADTAFRFGADYGSKIAQTFRHAFHQELPSAKKTTRVGIVASAFKPKGGWSDVDYGISGLYHLPGQEKRTWINSRLKSSHSIQNFLY